MNEEKTPVVRQIDAEKATMYQNFANRRLLIALISVIIGFIVYASIFIIGYTIREQNWQTTTVKIIERFAPSEVSNEILTNTDY